MSIDWSRFSEIVAAGQKFLLTSHMRPDCDAMGSELGMAGVLESLGKEVLIVNVDPVPPHLTFIDPEKRIKVLGTDCRAEDLAAVDVMMVLDTSAWVQLGPMGDVFRATEAQKVVIDHHVSDDDLGAEVFKDSAAEATGRLVIEAARALGVALTPAMATPLFAAIATDTGWFRFDSVCGATFRAAAELVDAGAVPHAIFSSLYGQNSLERLLLRGRILTAIERELDGRLIFTCVTSADFEATGAARSDTEDVVNMLLSIAGSEVALIFQEQRDGRVKASLRSQGETDVQRVAARFGGGGHRAAAGVMLDGPMDVARRTIVDAVREAMQ